MKFVRILIAASLAAGAAACDSSHSPTGSGGNKPVKLAEHQPATGTVAAGDSVVYDATLSGAPVRVAFQARSGSDADTLVADVFDASLGQQLMRVASFGSDTGRVRQAPAWIQPSAGVHWRIVVHGLGADDAGPYTLQLVTADPRPEHVPAAITVGQTVEGESVDVGGDVDEFRFTAKEGDEVILFAQAGQPWSDLKMVLVDSASGQGVGGAETSMATGALEEISSGRVKLPHAGTYLVRVTSGDGLANQYGPYRFRLDAVNRAPEGGSAALALGAVVEEALGSVGDVDEYHFTAHAGQEMNLLLQLESGMADGLRLELLRGTSPVPVVALQANAPVASLNVAGTGRMPLEEGEYTVRVQGPVVGMPERATGRYRFELYPVDRRPETPGQPALDAPAFSGAIDRPGDVDEFPLAGRQGQLVVLHISSTGSSNGALRAELMGLDGSLLAGAQTGYDAPASEGYSLRAELPATGTYTLRVRNSDFQPMAYGPYAVESYTVNPLPEHVPATIQYGQTVTGESIDRPGDLDVFTLQGDPSRQVNIFLGRPDPLDELDLRVVKAGDTGPVWIFSFAGAMTLDGTSTGRATLDPVPYQLMVDANNSSLNPSTTGPYALRVFPIDPRPEGRAQAYVLGDTVSGEPLYPAGDIDSYTFQLPVATAVHIAWDTPPITTPEGAVWGTLSNAQGPLWTNFNTNNGELVRDLTLPAGSYVLTVSNLNITTPSYVGTPKLPTLNYRFAIIPR